MSYAIIRNAKYKAAHMPSISRHNERQNKEYGNKDIDTSRTHENYHFVEPKAQSYEKEFERLREENGLKGNLRLSGKKQSNIACEFLITSDKTFFDSLGAEKTREFFADCQEFVKNKCGEKNIISSVVHMDESTPHMHVTYIPVVKGKDKAGNECERINCSQFWKGFNSYGQLQDNFHRFCIERGYDLERGEIGSQKKHLDVAEYKKASLEYSIEKLANQKDELQGQIQSIKGQVVVMGDLQNIQPQKTLAGAIKGVTVEQIENLKKTAIEYYSLTAKYNKLTSEFAKLKSQVGSNLKLKMENGQLENKIRLLTNALNESNGKIDAVNQVLEKMPEPVKDAFIKEYQAIHNSSQPRVRQGQHMEM